MLGLDFHVISIFCSHRTLYRIHTWELFVQNIRNMEYGKIFVRGKIKSGRRLVVASSTPASRFRTEKSPSNKNLPNMMLKTRFPFLYASTSLDTKALTIASNRNFESCLSIRCLAPQHIFRFFQFGAGISFASGNFALYCVVLLNAPLSDRDQKKKNVSAIHVTFPGKSWSIVIDARRSHCTIGLRFQEAR